MSLNANDSVLIVGGTPANVTALVEMLGREAYRVLVAHDGDGALEQAHHAMPLTVLLDVTTPQTDGFEVCRRLKSTAATAEIPVIFMTSPDEQEIRAKGFDAGGADYIVEPFEHQEVLARVRTHVHVRRLQLELARASDALERNVADRVAGLQAASQEIERMNERLRLENQYLRQEISARTNHGMIVGASAGLQQALQQADIAAATDTNVLIHGETGTGKELIARAIHERGPRRERPLIKFDCSAILAESIDGELFGHMKRSGGSDRHVGRFQLADGGTLLLDAVSELPLDTQTKLLRVLQEGELAPADSSVALKIDVRLIATCNRDLQTEVAKGRFSADLYHRLSVLPIEVPPLRTRVDDIAVLAQFFLERFARKLGKPLRGIDPQALERLKAHSWPGNVRELRNTIERAAILSSGELLRVDWQLEATTQNSSAAVAMQDADAATPANGRELYRLETVERQHFITVLKKTRGVIEGPKGAALLLDLKPSTARFRIKKLGIKKEEYVG